MNVKHRFHHTTSHTLYQLFRLCAVHLQHQRIDTHCTSQQILTHHTSDWPRWVSTVVRPASNMLWRRHLTNCLYTIQDLCYAKNGKKLVGSPQYSKHYEC